MQVLPCPERLMKKHINPTTQYIILVCVLLLAVDLVFGAVMMSRTAQEMKTLIRKNMQSVADTAAAAVDGDVLKNITAEDTVSHTPAYHQIADVLILVQRAQHDDNIKYIYTVTKEGDHFIFLVDPDEVKPAAFGQTVVYTPMLAEAWETHEGRVDTEKYEDEWGRYYSAWSPVRDSGGEVIAIVGVDFGADLYDAELARTGWSIGLVSILSLLVGILIVSLLTFQLRHRFRTLNTEISTLSTDVETLSNEILMRPGDEKDSPEEEPIEGSDTISTISEKIRVMQKKLKRYMDYVHEQAFTDPMTGVGNKTSYLSRVKELNAEINAGVASFAIVVFDVNGLKSTNDNYGHECGDRIITDASAVICRVFPKEQIYRIGGDEFIALSNSATEKVLEGKYRQLTQTIAEFNRSEKKYAMTLSFSWGGAVYRPGQDADVKAVFKRADEEMYRNKNDYYRQTEQKDPAEG